MNLIGSTKTGKSLLALALAWAVASGGLFLGRYQTTQGRVLNIDNELHPETMAHRLRAMQLHRAVSDPSGPESHDQSGIENLDVLSMRGGLKTLDDLQPIIEALASRGYAMIVLDALYRFFPHRTDENDNAAITALYNTIDRYSQILGGASFVIVHHTSKGGQSRKSVTDVGSGAGAFSRAADTLMVLRPHQEKNVVVADFATRSWPTPDPFCIRPGWPNPVIDESLDPSKLLNWATRRRQKAELDSKEPPPAPWTPDRFCLEFLSVTPRAKAAIMHSARAAGLRKIDAEGLLARTVEDSLSFVHTHGTSKHYATQPQTSEADPGHEVNDDLVHPGSAGESEDFISPHDSSESETPSSSSPRGDPGLELDPVLDGDGDLEDDDCEPKIEIPY